MKYEMVSIYTIFEYLFCDQNVGWGTQHYKEDRVVYMPAYNNNIPHGNNQWLVLI